MIYTESLRIVAESVSSEGFDPADMGILHRMVHACGMPDLVDDVRISPEFRERAAAALRRGAPIISDCTMVKSGIIQSALPAGVSVIETLSDTKTSQLAVSLKTTRSAAAVELWRPMLNGAIVVIGNAPTALFHLLEVLDQGEGRPAVLVACPVGFVGASESKQAVTDRDRGIPFVTVLGQRGGSAIAAAVINAVSLDLRNKRTA